MDRWLHLDTLILIPTLKIYIFLYDGQRDRWLHVDVPTLIPMLKIFVFLYDGQSDGDIYPGGAV